MKKHHAAPVFAVIMILMIHAHSFAAPVPVYERGADGAFANFLYTATPEIEWVRQTPTAPRPGQSVRVAALVRQSSELASLPVKRVMVTHKIGSTGWTTVEMLRDDHDPNMYIAILPPARNGDTVQYYVSAYDVSGGMSSEMPGHAEGFPNNAANMIEVVDENVPESVLPADVDVTALRFGYDGEFFYVQGVVEGKPGPGNMAKQGAYLYLLPVLNHDTARGIEDFMALEALVYAPVAGQMLGIEPQGLFKISEVVKDLKNVKSKEVKFKKGENSLSFRFNRADIGAMPSGRIEVGMLTMSIKSFEGAAPQESAPFLTAYLRTHSYTAKDEADAAAPLSAGVAEVEITPPVGTPLAGYGDRQGAPSTGVHDPLLAQALVLRAGDETVVFVSADFFLMRRKFHQDLAAAMEKRLGIPRERLITMASHAHCTSGGMFPELAILGGRVSPGLYEATLDKFIAAIEKAHASLAPARIGFATGDATGYSNNRRYEGGLTDPRVRVMRVDRAGGGPLAVLFNFAAHPTVLGGGMREFSADFVGPARDEIEKEFPGATAMFANGTQGDQGPACPGDCGSGLDRVAKGGAGLGRIAADTARAIQTTDEVSISFISQDIIIQPEYGIRITMDGVRINGTALLTIPGEMYAELGKTVIDAAAQKGFDNLFLFGISNDGIGYLIPEHSYFEHVYEATFALFGPGEGEFIRDRLLALLEML